MASNIAKPLEAMLQPLGFEPFVPEGVDGHVFLRRRTWNTNRAVAVVDLPEGEAFDVFVRRSKQPIGKALGYFPFFYGLGLQLVVVCDELPSEATLKSLVDKVDTQTVILQSVHAVERNSTGVVSARTWGQVVTGPFIDAIEAALQDGDPSQS